MDFAFRSIGGGTFLADKVLDNLERNFHLATPDLPSKRNGPKTKRGE